MHLVPALRKAVGDIYTVNLATREVTNLTNDNFADFAPTILTSGTRDLLLSNTVRVHRKLRDAGVESFLQVFEAQSHAHYLRDPAAPETKATFREISGFFDKHMAK